MRLSLYISLLYIVMASSFPGLRAQSIVTKLDSLSRCPDSLVMPVMVEDFQGVASLSLKINYDTVSLTYKGYQNLNPALAGNFLANGFNGQVIMSWFNLNPVTIGNGLMVEIKFIYKNNTDVILNWDDNVMGNCVYTDLDGNELPAIFEDGQIHGLMQTPQGISPANQSSGIPTNPVLHWSGSGCTPLYHLELSTDSLFGSLVVSNPAIFGTSLTVSDLNLETTYFWRVKAFNVSFTTAWSMVNRFKTTTVGLGESIVRESMSIELAPNPSTAFTILSFPIQNGESYLITLFNTLGEILQCEEILAHTDEKINYRINTGNLPAGLYLVRAEPKNAGLKMGKSARLLVTNP